MMSLAVQCDGEIAAIAVVDAPLPTPATTADPTLPSSMEIVKEELQLAQNAFAERVCAWAINITHYNDRG